MGLAHPAALGSALLLLGASASVWRRTTRRLRPLVLDAGLAALAIIWIMIDARFEGPVLLVLPAIRSVCPTHGIVLADLPALALFGGVALHAARHAVGFRRTALRCELTGAVANRDARSSASGEPLLPVSAQIRPEPGSPSFRVSLVSGGVLQPAIADDPNSDTWSHPDLASSSRSGRALLSFV